jgi:hypothetical protein
LLSLQLLGSSLLTGLVFSALLIGVFLFTWHIEATYDVPLNSSFFAYLSIALMQMINLLAIRTPHTLFTNYNLANKMLLAAFVLMFASVVFVWFYITPPYQLAKTNYASWLSPFGAALLFLAYTELRKKYFPALNPY